MNYSFMVDINGYQLNDEEKKILSHSLVGAVILFSRNLKNKEQLMELIADIRTINKNIFIAVDHEGGNVQRFQRNNFRSIPSARVIGEIYDTDGEAGIKSAYRYGKQMAQDLLDCGVDLSLAPVVDLHDSKSKIIGGLDRAFHKDPEVVAKLAEAFIIGMNDAGMPSVVKHFPGHGCVSSDSHVSQPIYDVSYEHLLENDLKPYELLIQKNRLTAVMPAHVLYPQIDPNHVAGYSEIWLEGILRNKLGFTGFILSDCLSMAGADVGDLKTRAEHAFTAGCNMAIVANQPRGLLIELLETLSVGKIPQNNKYLEDFKNKIPRFKNKLTNNVTKFSSIWSPINAEKEEEKVIENSLNKNIGI